MKFGLVGIRKEAEAYLVDLNMFERLSPGDENFFHSACMWVYRPALKNSLRIFCPSERRRSILLVFISYFLCIANENQSDSSHEQTILKWNRDSSFGIPNFCVLWETFGT